MTTITPSLLNYYYYAVAAISLAADYSVDFFDLCRRFIGNYNHQTTTPPLSWMLDSYIVICNENVKTVKNNYKKSHLHNFRRRIRLFLLLLLLLLFTVEKKNFGMGRLLLYGYFILLSVADSQMTSSVRDFR